MIADTKSIEEATGREKTTYDKITRISQSVVLGASGFSDFRRSLLRRMGIAPEGQEPKPFLNNLEETFEQMARIHGNDFRGNIGLLVGTREGEKCQLYAAENRGLAVPVTTYRALGSSPQCGELFLSKFWGGSLTMEQTAALGLLVIEFIETYKLDPYVGIKGTGEPNIWFMEDGISGLTYKLSPAMLPKLESYAKEKLGKIDQLIAGWGN